MSQTSLCLATRDVLRHVMAWTDEECDLVDEPGRPPAACGQLFCGVWGLGVSNDSNDSRSDMHELALVLTARSTVAPYDREAEEVLYRQGAGLEVLADLVADVVHNNYDIVAEANNLICGAVGNRPAYGFSEPLRFVNSTRAQKKNGDWFHGDPAEKAVGMAVVVKFGRAHRLQSNLYLFQGGR